MLMGMNVCFIRRNEVLMSINKFNDEGYYDPTTYEALTSIEKEKRSLEHLDLLCMCVHRILVMWMLM